MTRFEDWPIRLDRFLQAASGRPFSWGGHGGGSDCALFAADAVQAIRGDDPAAAFRGRYTTAIGAARALKRYGAGDLESTATMMLGEPLANPLLAQRGDVVSVDTEDGPALGVCVGAKVAVVGKTGLVQMQLRGARKAWRV